MIAYEENGTRVNFTRTEDTLFGDLRRLAPASQQTTLTLWRTKEAHSNLANQ
jgi:hypothetical protein